MRTKVSSITLLAGILSILLAVVAKGAFNGTGSGTEADPYIITNVPQLQEMNDDLAAWYELGNDIDASDTENWNGGEGFSPIGRQGGTAPPPFTGSFDGRGYAIAGLYINRPDSRFVGLFGVTGGSVKNVVLESVDVTGNWFTGGLAGTSNGNVVINCHVTGDVKGTRVVGGVLGYLSGLPTVECSRCSFHGNVRNTGEHTGGLVGFVNNASLSNCYSNSTVTGAKWVGGLLGYNQNGKVDKCYSASQVSGAAMVGGLLGDNYGFGTCSESFWDVEASGQSWSAGGTGKTTAEMKQQATFFGWDFNTVWDIVEGQSYPFLRGVGGEPPGENQPPIASFTYSPETPKSGEHVTFDASGSSDPDGDIISYEWDFGDGETVTGCQAPHRFRGATNEPKVYQVTLTVRDGQGATGSITTSVTVYPLTKPVEVWHRPKLGDPAFAKMTVTYNWIHDDRYVISKVDYESDGFLGFGDISVWDTHSHVFPVLRWAAMITSFESEKTYYPILERIEYGGETFEGIGVYASDAMNVYIIGFVGIGWGTSPIELLFSGFFKTSSANFVPDSTEEPELPIEPPDLCVAHLCSPGELRIYDSEGRVTGLVGGQIREEIPDSYCDNNTILIAHPSDIYMYEVVGTEVGTYELDTGSIVDGQATTFTAIYIPTSTTSVHQYTMDWDALSAGEEGVILEIDNNGDGFFEQMVIADNELSYDEFALQTETVVDFDPDTLNLKSQGKFVTVYIELPEDIDASEIDLFSLALNELIPPLPKPIEIGDYDSDGTNDLKVKFDLQELIAVLEPGEQIIDLTGRLWDGRPIAGFDFIRVIH